MRRVIQKSPSHDTVPGDEHTRPEFARAALLTIDMQADFISGPHAVPGTEQIATPAREVPDVEQIEDLSNQRHSPVFAPSEITAQT